MANSRETTKAGDLNYVDRRYRETGLVSNGVSLRSTVQQVLTAPPRITRVQQSGPSIVFTGLQEGRNFTRRMIMLSATEREEPLEIWVRIAELQAWEDQQSAAHRAKASCRDQKSAA